MNTREGLAWRALAAARGAGAQTLWRIAGYLGARRQTASWLLENPEELRAALMASKAVIAPPDFSTLDPIHPGPSPGRRLSCSIRSIPFFRAGSGSSGIKWPCRRCCMPPGT